MQLLKTFNHYYPNFKQLIEDNIEDLRDNRGKRYTMHDAIGSIVVMFLFKEGSRNSYNQDCKEPKFRRSIRRALKIKLMNGDTFNDIMVQLDEDGLHQLKVAMAKGLIANKIFCPYRYQGKYIIAIDATGTHSFKQDYTNKTSLRKESKNGVATYSYSVLEAKLVGSNGFCVSLASAWLENNEKGEHDKQDCELAAFKRMAAKIKALYPRLPIIIVCDALYCNAGVADICKKNTWDYMLAIKDTIQKDLNEEITLRPDRVTATTKKGQSHYLNDLRLSKHKVSWLKFQEAGKIFSWISNLEIRGMPMVEELQAVGRLRWKIENEGFNTQKNLGYALEHKFSRIDFNATKNYYQCLQIAHLIEQLCLLGNPMKRLIPATTSIIKLSERMRNYLVFVTIGQEVLDRLLCTKIQVRFE